MITELHIQDFIAHKDTKLEFGKGVTIFVGHNGSGKSSVIDAITYALFGQHTRRSAKNLVRRGARQGSVQLQFSINSREYSATRVVGGTDSRSQLTLLADGSAQLNRPIAGGERKQFGESMSNEVAKVLGLDYDKMCVASVVQQGELLRIVDYSPKDFKELLNGLIGIEKLDSAYGTMKDVIAGFRERLHGEIGYSDEEIPKLEKLVDEKKAEQEQAQQVLAELEEERKSLEGRIATLEERISQMEPIAQKIQDLASKERMLVRHITERRSAIETDIARLERVARDANELLKAIESKDEICMRLQMSKAEAEELQQQIEENEGMRGKLKGLLECAGRLQIVDGKCPACGSAVNKLNSVFDIGHIGQEITKLEDRKAILQRSKIEQKKEEQKLSQQEAKIEFAEKFLRDNSIGSGDDIAKIASEVSTRKSCLAGLPAEITRVGTDPSQLAIDGISKSIAEEIAAIRKQLSAFSQKDFTDAKLEKDNCSRKLQDASRRIGIYQKTADDAGQDLESANNAIGELRGASEFLLLMEKIRASVFNRDGPIGTSLRSWAIKVISEKASEYAMLFNIGISRIELAEKPREIAITCYGRYGEIDMDSLSGGEKVAVALALRLGIAYMMGSNKLDFVILDEPTTHLDEERRKALVRIVSEAFREGSGPISQLIIITHDSEIFEDSDVDKVYRFSMTAEGSQVVAE